MLINVIRPVPAQTTAFVKMHEGLKLAASPDVAGHMDAGYGHDDASLRPGQQITQEQADAWLLQDLGIAAHRLEGAVGGDCVAELTDNQYAAMISFTFNVGIDPKWTICAKLKAQDFDAIPGELMRFVNAGGQKVQGLVNRRADEVKLWSTAEPGSVPEYPSSSQTRAIDTPPTSAVTKPLAKSKSMIGSCVAACLTAASAAAPHLKEASDGAAKAIAPYVGQSEVLQAVSSHLALVAAAAALAVPALLWLKNHEAKTQ